MKTKRIHLSLFAGLLLAACSVPQYQITDDGVILNLKQEKKADVKKLRLQVLGDELIHVSATPDNDFPKDSSLIIVPGLQPVPFQVDDAGDSIMLSTSRLKVMVSKLDGGIKFKDKNGQVILAEKPGGGKTFSPIEVEGTNGYSVRQLFDSPADEDFYGLGQHQSDEFN